MFFINYFLFESLNWLFLYYGISTLINYVKSCLYIYIYIYIICKQRVKFPKPEDWNLIIRRFTVTSGDSILLSGSLLLLYGNTVGVFYSSTQLGYKSLTATKELKLSETLRWSNKNLFIHKIEANNPQTLATFQNCLSYRTFENF